MTHPLRNLTPLPPTIFFLVELKISWTSPMGAWPQKYSVARVLTVSQRTGPTRTPTRSIAIMSSVLGVMVASTLWLVRYHKSSLVPI